MLTMQLTGMANLSLSVVFWSFPALRRLPDTCRDQSVSIDRERFDPSGQTTSQFLTRSLPEMLFELGGVDRDEQRSHDRRDHQRHT